MPTNPPVRRRSLLAAVALAVMALVAAQSSPASAAPIPITWNVDATTTLKNLGLTVDVPGGTFTGSVDLATGNLTGDMTLPPSSTVMKIGSLPLATAVFEMAQAQPITGHIDFATLTVTTTASFNIKLRSLRPTLLPWINLVGDRCQTASPITVTMGGQVNLAGTSTFTGTYAIPKFKDCGWLVTPIINLIIPSSGNTFSATFAPPVA